MKFLLATISLLSFNALATNSYQCTFLKGNIEKKVKIVQDKKPTLISIKNDKVKYTAQILTQNVINEDGSESILGKSLLLNVDGNNFGSVYGTDANFLALTFQLKNQKFSYAINCELE